MSKQTMAAILLVAVRLNAAGLSAVQRQSIDKILGGAGVYTAAENTHRLTFPRNDVKVTVDGTALHPFLGLTSWAAFTAGANNSVMVMGDLVLFEDEVNPAMSAALDSGLEVTALHNHFFFDNPRVMFMHVGGSGEPETLAASVRKALDAVREIRQVSAEPTRQFGGRPVPPVSFYADGSSDSVELRVTSTEADDPRLVVARWQGLTGRFGKHWTTREVLQVGLPVRP